MSKHEDRPAVDVEALRVTERIVSTLAELDDLPEEVHLVDDRGREWAHHDRWSGRNRDQHRSTLADRLPLRVERHPDDRREYYSATKVSALLAEHAALVEEVERLRGAASDIERLSDTYTQEGADIVMRRILNLRDERDEAIERATKAEQVISDVRELAERSAPHALSDHGQIPFRMAMAKVLALLPDETGGDRD